MAEIAEVVAKLLGALLLVAATIFISPLIGVALGAFSGWVVGIFWSNTLTAGLAALGITGLKIWQVGATLGFVGGFFKSHLGVKQSEA